MAASSNYLTSSLLGELFRGSAWTAPTTLYIALCTSTPTASSTGATIAEVSTSGTAYARVAVTCNTSNWTSVSGGSLSNAVAITFPTATASWGTVTAVAILDSSTAGAGNLLYYAALTTSKSPGSGDTFQFGVGEVTVSMT